MDDGELVLYALEAMKNAYVPYSKFRVGAALLTIDGKVFTGCNIENASFGGTNCAERTAFFKAISEGYKNFIKIAITSDSEDFTYPCGICRQVMSEFCTDIDVIVANRHGKFKSHKLKELFPNAFTKDELERGIVNVKV